MHLRLPLEYGLLTSASIRAGSFSRSLRYKELGFNESPSQAGLLDLMEANTSNDGKSMHSILLAVTLNAFGSLAGLGLIAHAQKTFGLPARPHWFEKVSRWDLALAAWTKSGPSTSSGDRLVGRLRCLVALKNWREAAFLVKKTWKLPEMISRRTTVAELAAATR